MIKILQEIPQGLSMFCVFTEEQKTKIGTQGSHAAAELNMQQPQTHGTNTDVLSLLQMPLTLVVKAHQGVAPNQSLPYFYRGPGWKLLMGFFSVLFPPFSLFKDLPT